MCARASRSRFLTSFRSAASWLLYRPCRQAPLARPVGAPAVAPWKWQPLADGLMVDGMNHLLTDPAANAEAEGGRADPVGDRRFQIGQP